MRSVYLAGGMKTNWRESIKEQDVSVTWYDPSMHGRENPRDYTEWDLRAIRSSEILFGFLEDSNPSGMGICLEIGYAKALGKTIIFVNEKSDKRFEIAENCANYFTRDLSEGILILFALLKRE